MKSVYGILKWRKGEKANKSKAKLYVFYVIMSWEGGLFIYHVTISVGLSSANVILFNRKTSYKR